MAQNSKQQTKRQVDKFLLSLLAVALHILAEGELNLSSIKVSVEITMKIEWLKNVQIVQRCKLSTHTKILTVHVMIVIIFCCFKDPKWVLSKK